MTALLNSALLTGVTYDAELNEYMADGADNMEKLVRSLRAQGYSVNYYDPANDKLLPYDVQAHAYEPLVTATLPRIIKCLPCSRYVYLPTDNPGVKGARTKPVDGDKCDKCGADLFTTTVHFSFDNADGTNFLAEVAGRKPSSHELFLRLPVLDTTNLEIILSDQVHDELAQYARFWTLIEQGGEQLLVVNYNEGGFLFDGAINIVSSNQVRQFEYIHLFNKLEYLHDELPAGVGVTYDLMVIG